jgi:hypothetical protein
MASQSLLNPRYVRFHTTGKDDPDTKKTYAFLVVHEDEGGHLSGSVLCLDDDNDAGLSVGWNERTQIGRGDPDKNVSWSEFPDEA